MSDIRINKYVADQGWSSRREADVLIERGKVLINGKKAMLGQKVSEKDEVTLIGSTKEKEYYAYYKGRGIISHSPDETEVDISMQLKEMYGLTGIYPVGRLDKDSEGLMILTNDGRVTKPLLDSSGLVEKEYLVQVDKKITNHFLKSMQSGVRIEGYKTKVAQVEKKGEKAFLLILTEGKKHQIRRMCAALGYQVQSLKRIRVANIQLKALRPNQYRKIVGKELQVFLDRLNIKRNS